MPAGRDQRRAASIAEGLRGLLDMGAGALKGGVQGMVGMPGDIEDLVRSWSSSPSARVLPTTEEVGKMLPKTGSDTATFEAVGENLNPVESLKPLLAAGKGVAAAKAMFVPALLKQKDFRLAQSILTPEELWREMGLHRAPVRPRDPPGVTRYLREIDDTNAMLGPNVKTLSTQDKLKLIKQDFEPLAQEGAKRRVAMSAIPAEGEYRQGDLLDHPELYKDFPELMDEKVKVYYDPKVASKGSYNRGAKETRLNIAAPFNYSDEGGGVLGTNLHELTHSLADKYNLPQGAVPSMYQVDPSVWGRLESELSRPEFTESLGPEGARHATNLLKRSGDKAFKIYRDAPGEKYASAAQKRFGMDPDMRQALDPNKYELKGVYDEPDPEFAYYLLHSLKHVNEKGGSTDPIATWLRNWGTLAPK